MKEKLEEMKTMGFAELMKCPKPVLCDFIVAMRGVDDTTEEQESDFVSGSGDTSPNGVVLKKNCRKNRKSKG